MSRLRFQRIAWTIAWRDLWTGRRHFAVGLAALAVGVAAMNASRALGGEFSSRLNGDLRQWIAADATVTLRQPPSEEQDGETVKLAREGIELTESLETFSMASSDQAADPVLVSVKSVDARRYPWYGSVELEPHLPLAEALRPDTLVVSRTLADRLAVAPGNRMLLNGVDFRIAAILSREPDGMAAAPHAVPRVMLSSAAFARARIVLQGNAITWRLLFRIPPGSDAGGLKTRLQQAFPDGQVADYRDHGDPRAAAALNAALTYLDLTAWTAFALGSLGVALVIYLHLERRLDTIAAMRVLGGRWGQILAVYLMEIGCLSLAGCAIGVAMAVPLERAFLWMIRGPLPVAALPWRWSQASEGVGLGVLSSLAAMAVPLVAVRTTAPMQVLRRLVEHSPARRRMGRLAAFLCLLGIVALAVWMVRTWQAGATFLFGMSAGGVILWGTGHGLLRLLRWTAGRWNRRLPIAWFHGMMNLSGPGRRGVSRFVALAVGVMVVVASWLGPAEVVRAVEQSVPLPGADLFVYGLGPGQTGPLRELLRADPDVNPRVELLPVIILRLAKVDGAPVPADAPERWVATCSTGTPSGPLSAGRWWRAGAAAPEAVMAKSLAGIIGVAVGGTVEFWADGRAIPARIVGLRRLDAIEEQRGGLVFPCSAFTGLNVSYEAAIKVGNSRAEEVGRMVAARYPNVQAISRRELVAAIQSVAHDAIRILRAVALLILAAGTAILIVMVLAEERTRSREIAILKALGAGPSQVRNGLLAEFAWLGVLAGASGGVMGSLFASLLLSAIFRKTTAAWDLRVVAGATVLGALIAVAAGWASTAGAVRQRTFAILRDE
jgi:putative ABC transport system permease protein